MKKNKSHSHIAFTLAEVLITLLVISLIALGTTWVVPKKTNVKKFKEHSHGSYACGYIGNSLYEYTSGDNDIPPYDASSWSGPVTSCGDSLSIPDYVEALSVYVVGGGGGGASAVNTSTNYSWSRTVNPGTAAQIPKTGLYDIEAVGATGTSSIMSVYSAGTGASRRVCLVPNSGVAPGGNPASFRGRIQLEQGEYIDFVQKTPYIPVMANSTFCTTDLDKPSIAAGNTERTYISRRYGAGGTQTILEIKSSQGGYFTCSESYPCGNFTAHNGSAGTVSFVSSLFTNRTTSSSSGMPSLRISWSSANPASSSSTSTSGCGGSAGTVRSSVYPIFQNGTVPAIRIGRGGAPASDGESSSFGDLSSPGGAKGTTTSCGHDPSNPNYGSDGGKTVIEDIEFLGGEHSTATGGAGGNARGFGAGGAGGTVPLGAGGSGAGGMVWVFW